MQCCCIWVLLLQELLQEDCGGRQETELACGVVCNSIHFVSRRVQLKVKSFQYLQQCLEAEPSLGPLGTHFAPLVEVDGRLAEIRPPERIAVGPVLVVKPRVNEKRLSNGQTINIKELFWTVVRALPNLCSRVLDIMGGAVEVKLHVLQEQEET